MNDQESRRDQRVSVLKAGKVVFDNVLFDCMVLDISPNGARVRFSIPIALPESLVLRIRGGPSYPATRRWSRGTEVGLEFTGPPIVDNSEMQSRHADVALDLLNTTDLARCLDLLQRERFFGNETLRQTAETARDAYANLHAMLKQHTVKALRPKPTNEG